MGSVGVKLLSHWVQCAAQSPLGLAYRTGKPQRKPQSLKQKENLKTFNEILEKLQSFKKIHRDIETYDNFKQSYIAHLQRVEQRE